MVAHLLGLAFLFLPISLVNFTTYGKASVFGLVCTYLSCSQNYFFLYHIICVVDDLLMGVS